MKFRCQTRQLKQFAGRLFYYVSSTLFLSWIRRFVRMTTADRYQHRRHSKKDGLVVHHDAAVPILPKNPAVPDRTLTTET